MTTDDPKLNAWLHKRLLIFWVVLLPFAMFTGLNQSIEFLVGISLIAIIISEWAAYQQATAEIKMDTQMEPLVEESNERTSK